ncbi:LuxR C-terminal-related transcriptional regulator [Bacillus licheniformis]|nr:LuxR C-terminal-related transcriptional regulator [Bacillus licheniformis]
MASGKTNKEIAADLQMSTRNVEYHLSKSIKAQSNVAVLRSKKRDDA